MLRILPACRSAFARRETPNRTHPAKKHGGTDDAGNLALACIDCNLHKGVNLTGIDPDTGKIVELFNPRRQRWEEHFAWSGCIVIGITAVGRTTIRVLDINSEDRVRVRLANA